MEYADILFNKKKKNSFKCKIFIKLDEPMRQNKKFKPNKTPIKSIKFTLFLYDSLFLFKKHRF